MKKLLLVFGGLFLLCFISASVYATPVDFEINAGGFGYETSWAIDQLTGGSWSAGMATGTMASYTNYTFNWDLSAGDYLLEMGDTFGDGLDNGGHVYLAVAGNVLLDQVGNVFGSYYSFPFEVNGNNPVPEPSTMILLGFGLVGLAGVARKKMKK
ncbi:MAG: PEP-CTERM sorting domain-containing protein [Desulfobacterales bacterium]|jgi:hypothetical protein|nr:PEP-CTERM sorting domain-containing protein [Desulfobacterales bacterium]